MRTENGAVRRAVEQLGGTVAAAKTIGASAPHVSSWKSGARKIPEEKAKALCDAAYGGLLDTSRTELAAMLRGNRRVEAGLLLERAAKLLSEAGDVN